MEPDWVNDWEECLLKPTIMPGYSSCSESLAVALGFATKNSKVGNEAVLFAITILNTDCSGYTQLDNEAFSSYPSEKEILLMEGRQIYVLAV